MNILERDNIRVLRAEILKAIHENHRQRRPRLRLIVLQGHLDRLYFDVGEDDLITVLEDMQERGYLSFERDPEAWKQRKVLPMGMQITPRGRDLVEGTNTDPAVQFD
jgi:hypothetical protein